MTMEHRMVCCSRLYNFPGPCFPQRLRFICIQGLGKRRFEVALKLLQCLQRGDRKVLHDGVEYDGKEGKQVSLTSVRGGNRASEE